MKTFRKNNSVLYVLIVSSYDRARNTPQRPLMTAWSLMTSPDHFSTWKEQNNQPKNFQLVNVLTVLGANWAWITKMETRFSFLFLSLPILMLFFLPIAKELFR